MTRANRNISLTQDHYELILRVATKRHMKFSEALRCIIEFAIDHDATLGLPVLANREKSLQAELLTVQEAKKKLEERKSEIEDSAGTPSHSLGVDRVRAPAPETVVKPYTDKRPPRTDEEQFLKAATYVANEDRVVTPELKKKVLAQARAHAEWLATVPEPERNKLEAMLKIPKAGGQEI